MPIKIKSTSGSVTLDAQNVSGDQTLTVPSQASATLQTTADTIASTRLTGTIADARFPATLPAVSGASLTNIPGPGAGTVTEAMVHADTFCASKVTEPEVDFILIGILYYHPR